MNPRTVSITADNFTFEPNSQGKALYSFKQSSPNDASLPIWHVVPRETGKKSLTISAVTDNGLSDMVTCQIIIIDLLGVNPSYLYNFVGSIFFLNFILFLQSLQEKKNKKRISKQESG